MNTSFKLILGTCAVVALLSFQPAYAEATGSAGTPSDAPAEDPVYSTDDISYTGYHPANIINPHGWGEGGEEESQDTEYSDMMSSFQEESVNNAGGDGGSGGGFDGGSGGAGGICIGC